MLNRHMQRGGFLGAKFALPKSNYRLPDFDNDANLVFPAWSPAFTCSSMRRTSPFTELPPLPTLGRLLSIYGLG